MKHNSETTRTLRSGFLAASQRFADRPALEVNGATLSYAQLRRRATQLAASLTKQAPDGGVPLTAVLAERSATAYAGVLAALFRGHGYVPLNPSFPAHRSRAMLQRAGCRAVIVDSSGEQVLPELLEGLPQPLVVCLPERNEVQALRRDWPWHTFLGSEEIENIGAGDSWSLPPARDDAIAYLLFTSGSTGVPKGVMVAHRNVTHFIDAMTKRYEITEHDRFSQIFELVFDLSVFDMFVAWQCGACVCCPSKADLLMPGQFIHDNRISVWFSVPSTGLLMKKLGMLMPGEFPMLRVSLFCGEALLAEVADAWATAAPNSIVENLYGPTEVTLACTLYRWDRQSSPAECENGVVPIGCPYPAMTTLVVDSELNEVAAGESGELLMAGPQVALGYWQDADKTAAAFVIPPGRRQVYYRTGDRVRRPVGDGPLRYLGRLDHQVQIHGYRVELGEIEAALREVAGVEAAVAIGWPVTESGADRVVAFLDDPTVDVKDVQRQLKSRLPHYMVPREVHIVSEFPYNSNGKIDRKALTATLQKRACAQTI